MFDGKQMDSISQLQRFIWGKNGFIDLEYIQSGQFWFYSKEL
jgi:hypothetical protein